jgi:hypothetical protein
MNLKNTGKNYWQPVAEQHYKKTYLVRKAQEIEAEKEIERYERETDLYPSPTSEVPYSQDVDAEG